jgi:serine/threonine-protein kinase HipA
MPYEPVKSIELRCWGEPVGALAFDTATGYYAFQYYPEFVRTGLLIAPLAMPLTAQRVFVFPNLPSETFFRLPACIADSLPDAFGNALIDAWMAARGVHREQITPLDRLAYLGNRAMGALEFAPPLGDDEQVPSALEMSELIEEARRAVEVDLHLDSLHAGQSQRLHPDSYAVSSELAQLIAVGTSAGGARAKAVVGYNPATEHFVSGQLTLPQGYSHWIIKFDVGASGSDSNSKSSTRSHEYGRIEYAYALMARDCGIKMAQSRLYEAAGRAHFMTRRFDRVEEDALFSSAAAPISDSPATADLPHPQRQPPQKLHLQTLCALAELDFRQVGAHDYNELFMTIERLGLPYEAIDQAFIRMVFNVCMANCDDHTKNHSFLMDAQGTWSLAPAYDLTHSYRADSYWVSRHLMSVNGRFEGITTRDLLCVAHHFNVADPVEVIHRVQEVAAQWPDYAKAAGISAATTKRIQADIQRFSTLAADVRGA